MADVFISYAKSRSEQAAELARNLGERGFNVWWDTRLVPTGSFRSEIDHQLDLAKAVVVIWSPESVASKWVSSEAAHADRQNKLINTNTSDLDPARQIPKPFDQIHSAGVNNVPAIVAALEALRVPRSAGKAEPELRGRVAETVDRPPEAQVVPVEVPPQTSGDGGKGLLMIIVLAAAIFGVYWFFTDDQKRQLVAEQAREAQRQYEVQQEEIRRDEETTKQRNEEIDRLNQQARQQAQARCDEAKGASASVSSQFTFETNEKLGGWFEVLDYSGAPRSLSQKIVECAAQCMRTSWCYGFQPDNDGRCALNRSVDKIPQTSQFTEGDLCEYWFRRK